jgi:hypothetical protein
MYGKKLVSLMHQRLYLFFFLQRLYLLIIREMKFKIVWFDDEKKMILNELILFNNELNEK